MGAVIQGNLFPSLLLESASSTILAPTTLSRPHSKEGGGKSAGRGSANALHCRPYFGRDGTEKGPKCDMPGGRGPGEGAHIQLQLCNTRSGSGRSRQPPRGQEAGVSNDSSWGLRVQPLKSHCLPSNNCCHVVPKPFLCPEMPQEERLPHHHTETIPAILGMGSTHAFCPAMTKEASRIRGMRAQVRASLHTRLCAGHGAFGHGIHPACSCCPTPSTRAA